MNLYTESLLQPEPWTRDALCAEVGGDMFFPDLGEAAHEAKKICAACPVRDACLEYALRNRVKEGIWGGMNYKARRRYATRRGSWPSPLP